ncbi:MAG: glycosyltransferase family 2 protein [Alphaproteobacteria bacterium]
MTLLSIIVPVYNEEGNVEPLYDAVNRALQPIADNHSWEFVFTDNCSTDRTFECLERLAARDPRVRAYRFTRNFGFQRSILTGYRLARGDAAVQIDCDLQDPPELIRDFVKLWKEGYKIVYGVRRSRPEPFYLRATRRVFYRLIAWLSSDELPPDAGDFRLIDRCVLDLLHAYNDENPYLRGYIASLGYRQIGVSYDRAPRQRGKSAFGFGSLVNLALDGIVGHSILPLRLASVVGVSLSLLALFAMAVYLVLWFAHDKAWPPGFATLAFLILTSLAVNAIFLGIIGEYLARIYRQVKPRPLTVVERFIDCAEPPARARGASTGRAVPGVVLPKDDSVAPSQAKEPGDGL